MLTTDLNTPLQSPRTCPLCDTPLDPANPNECSRCDWVPALEAPERSNTVRDRFAVVLSVVPGLGHWYKGHRLLGMALLAGSFVAAVVCIVAATASAGWGILLLPLYWVGVMLHVYWLEDFGMGKPITVPG